MRCETQVPFNDVVAQGFPGSVTQADARDISVLAPTYFPDIVAANIMTEIPYMLPTDDMLSSIHKHFSSLEVERTCWVADCQKNIVIP